jgi:hypothetical protein
MSQNQLDQAKRTQTAGGRDIDPRTGRHAAVGAFELTRSAKMYDSDGGISRVIAEDVTRQFFRREDNAVRASMPSKNVTYSTRWVSDYTGPVQDG